MPKSGVTLSRRPALSSLKSTFKSTSSRPTGLNLRPAAPFARLYDSVTKPIWGNDCPFAAGEGLADEAGRVDHVASRGRRRRGSAAS